MSKQTEALKLALEALEYISSHYMSLPKIGCMALAAGKEALAEQPAQPKQEPVAIKWTLDGDKTCRYNNWLGETPFGRILITWKGWKEYHDACVDEFPGDFNAYGSPDELKKMCEAEFAKRSAYTSTPASKPLTDEFILSLHYGCSTSLKFARAIEAAHGIKGDA